MSVRTSHTHLKEQFGRRGTQEEIPRAGDLLDSFDVKWWTGVTKLGGEGSYLDLAACANPQSGARSGWSGRTWGRGFPDEAVGEWSQLLHVGKRVLPHCSTRAMRASLDDCVSYWDVPHLATQLRMHRGCAGRLRRCGGRGGAYSPAVRGGPAGAGEDEAATAADAWHPGESAADAADPRRHAVHPRDAEGVVTWGLDIRGFGCEQGDFQGKI